MTLSRRLALMAAVVIVAAGVACSEEDPDKHQVVLVLVDVSTSSDDPEIRKRYLTYAESIIQGVSDSGGGQLLVDVIDDNPLAHSTLPVSEALTGCNLLEENRLTCDRRLEEQRASILATTETLLAQTTQGTDILGALDVAERVFDNYPEAEQKYLLLFSDMVQSAQGIHFANLDWDEAAASEVMSKVEPLPDLGSVEVYVAGAGTPKTGLNANQIQGMNSFWLDYFSQTGANLPEARYGSALIRFP